MPWRNVASGRRRDQARDPSPPGRGRSAAGPIQLGAGATEEGRRSGLASSSGAWRSRTLQKYDDAAEAFAQAAKLGYDPKNSELHRAGALRRAGHAEEAKKILGGLQKLRGPSAEYHYQQGSLLAAEGELAWPRVELEKALSLDRDHNGALFELAYINDLFGNDETAVEYYKRCTQRPPVPLAALINLGVLYEDEMRFREAEQCYRQVLAHDPNHPRARLFFKDCRASKGMYYDEEAEKRLHASSSSFSRSP